MIGQSFVGIVSAILGASLAIRPMQLRAADLPPACKDGCAATATLVAIPGGACGASMPTYRVEWGASTSGHCEGCTVVNHCNNHAQIFITAVGGTALHGGGFDCADGGVVTATISTCGQAATSQIMVHTGAPCDDANVQCFVYATIGCKNC